MIFWPGLFATAVTAAPVFFARHMGHRPLVQSGSQGGTIT